MSGPETSPPTPDGMLDRFMTGLFGRSWRTGLAGAVGFGCSVLPLLPVPQQVKDIAAVVGPIVMGGGLFFAKDHNVTGRS